MFKEKNSKNRQCPFIAESERLSDFVLSFIRHLGRFLFQHRTCVRAEGVPTLLITTYFYSTTKSKRTGEEFWRILDTKSKGTAVLEDS